MPRQPNEEELAQGTYWTPPCEVTLTEAHPRLLAALRAGAAIEQMHLFVAGAYDMGSGAPMGQLRLPLIVLVDWLAAPSDRSSTEKTSRAWFACANDLDAAIQLVLDTARAEGLVF